MGSDLVAYFARTHKTHKFDSCKIGKKTPTRIKLICTKQPLYAKVILSQFWDEK